MNPYQNLGAYNQQLRQIQDQIAGLQNVQYPPPPYQPVVLPQPEPEQVKTATGLSGAREQLQSLPPGSTAIRMDTNDDVFYLLKKDSNGVAQPIQICHFTVQTEQELDSPYVTKKDFEEFKNEMKTFLSSYSGKE